MAMSGFVLTPQVQLRRRKVEFRCRVQCSITGSVRVEKEPFRLHNTLTGSKDVFKGAAHEDGVVRFYSCGPTVYDYAHIGNFRAFLTYDVLKRWLIYRGYSVNHVMNLTDVDDKIIKRVEREGVSLPELTEKFAQLFFRDLSALNVIPADLYPRATAHIGDIVQLIEGLKEKDAAYESAGSTYFRVESFKNYGRLVRLEKRVSGNLERPTVSDSDEYEKGDARDFALWKAYKEEDGEVKWDTKLGDHLGVGRPGWHIECSCMAMKYLGPTVDIHGGGIDLVFPHHENEIAQSEAYSGKTFAKFWVHNGFVNVGGEKMSKSLGNFRTLHDVAKTSDHARAFRYLVVSSQYRSTLNFTEEVLKGARNTIKRLDGVRSRLREVILSPATKEAEVVEEESPPILATVEEVQQLIDTAKHKFCAAMNDDLNTPRAVAAMFDLISVVGKMLKSRSLSVKTASNIDSCLVDFDRVLGIYYEVPSSYFSEASAHDGNGTAAITEETIPDFLLQLLADRAEARKQRDFSRADEIRDKIVNEGYVVKDTPAGAKLVKAE